MQAQHIGLPDEVIAVDDDVHTQPGLQESGFRHRAGKNMIRPLWPAACYLTIPHLSGGYKAIEM
jgi:hypothetical protein